MAKKRKRKYSRSAGRDVKNEMHRYKRGTAKSGRGGKAGKVESRKQAIAIGLSKARAHFRFQPRRLRIPRAAKAAPLARRDYDWDRNSMPPFVTLEAVAFVPVEFPRCAVHEGGVIHVR